MNYEFRTGSELSIVYASNNPAVASVQASTGLVTTHKAGNAVLTARFQGQTYTCTLRVQNKGALKSSTTYKKMNQAAGKISRFYGKKISKKNSSAVFKAYAAYEKASKISKQAGLIFDGDVGRNLNVPLSLRAGEVIGSLRNYVENHTPFVWGFSPLKVSSVKAKAGTDKAEVTLSGKVTLDMVNGIRFAENRSQRKYAFAKSCTYTDSELFEVSYYDEETDDDIEMEIGAKITLKAGSRKVICQLFTSKNGKRKAFKLKKGMTLSTVSDDYAWKNTKKCKIK